MGVMKVASSSVAELRSLVEELATDPANRDAKLHFLLSEWVRRGQKIRVVYTTGHWLNVDSLEDVLAAGSFA